VRPAGIEPAAFAMSRRRSPAELEHDPEKWIPVFG
jgi:hypothetical protein